MKLRRFTSAGVEMARQYLAAVKESGDVENVTLNGQPLTSAVLISSPIYSDTSDPHFAAHNPPKICYTFRVN